MGDIRRGSGQIVVAGELTVDSSSIRVDFSDEVGAIILPREKVGEVIWNDEQPCPDGDWEKVDGSPNEGDEIEVLMRGRVGAVSRMGGFNLGTNNIRPSDDHIRSIRRLRRPVPPLIAGEWYVDRCGLVAQYAPCDNKEMPWIWQGRRIIDGEMLRPLRRMVPEGE